MSRDPVTAIPYLSLLPASADRQEICRRVTRARQRLADNKKGYVKFHQALAAIRHLRARELRLDQAAVGIGAPATLSGQDRQTLLASLRTFMPWRKGPFSVFGIEIDAEWRSNRKWERLQGYLPDLEGKLIADIGSNNGYYMFRMAHHRPRLVLGFEPYVQHYYCFQALNSLAGLTNLHTEPLGIEDLGPYSGCFDVIFVMGILYHRPDPITALKDIHRALAPGGTIIVESQGIAGSEPLALFPRKTYAKVPGTYFVPTRACLENWLTRAGFINSTCFCSHAMSSAEQRRTAWMTFESYDDFMDPADPSRTVEGYPAPIRIFIKAEKKQTGG